MRLIFTMKKQKKFKIYPQNCQTTRILTYEIIFTVLLHSIYELKHYENISFVAYINFSFF